MKKILLVKLSDRVFYKDAKVKAAVPHFPSLALATLAGSVRDRGHTVKIFEYNVFKDFNDAEKAFERMLYSFNPDVVGVGFTTPLFDEMKRVATKIKHFDKDISIICGGPHVSAFPEETIKTSPIDVCVIGEGDFIFADVVDRIGVSSLSEIHSIAFRDGGEVKLTPKDKGFLQDLDKLPFPAWDLFNLSEYHMTRNMCRKNPVGWIETSRGCLYGCVYCNKNIFGQNFRAKSAERTVDEMQYMLNCGFKEIQIAEDMFTTDPVRVEKICALIKERGLVFPWATTTGIRVDSVTPDMLKSMKIAGCYRVYYGLESGSQDVLNKIRKGATVQNAHNAVTWAKDAGLEVFGFFMIGLDGETEKSMQETINFATSLDLDFAKMSIMSPLPGTPIYNDYKKKGYLKNVDWNKFNYYVPPEELYTHPNLSWDMIHKYYKLFYRRFYFRPSFIVKRVLKSVQTGAIVDDVRGFVQNSWF